MGASTGKKNAGVSKPQQAEFLTQAYHCLSQYDYVHKAVWFNVADSGPDQSIYRYGLIATDGSHKPAFQALADVARGKDGDAGERCGDFDPPSLQISAPDDNGSFLDVLPIKAVATDSSGVGRITLMADGKLIRNFTTGKTRSTDFPKSLTGAITWQGAKKLALGQHTITAIALDGNGNKTTKTLRVTKVATGSLKGIRPTFNAAAAVRSRRNPAAPRRDPSVDHGDRRISRRAQGQRPLPEARPRTLADGAQVHEDGEEAVRAERHAEAGEMASAGRVPSQSAVPRRFDAISEVHGVAPLGRGAATRHLYHFAGNPLVCPKSKPAESLWRQPERAGDPMVRMFEPGANRRTVAM